MKTQPKPFIVYWTSQFVANDSPGWTTAKFKANMKSFKDDTKAREFHSKLLNLQKDGGTFCGRGVYHVGAYNG